MSLWHKVLKQLFHERYIRITNLLQGVAFTKKTTQKLRKAVYRE